WRDRAVAWESDRVDDHPRDQEPAGHDGKPVIAVPGATHAPQAVEQAEPGEYERDGARIGHPSDPELSGGEQEADPTGEGPPDYRGPQVRPEHGRRDGADERHEHEQLRGEPRDSSEVTEEEGEAERGADQQEDQHLVEALEKRERHEGSEPQRIVPAPADEEPLREEQGKGDPVVAVDERTAGVQDPQRVKGKQEAGDEGGLAAPGP